MADEDHAYHPEDAIKSARDTAFVTGGGGFLVAALRNALHKAPIGSMSVFTRSGGIMVSFALAGGAYGFTKSATANLRQKNDALNPAIGGFVGGAISGMSQPKMSIVWGRAALFAIVMGVFDLTGGRLRGWTDRPEEEEFERKLRLRANRRRPLEETIAEIGEGRGIQPPGYEERRRERLQEKYGVEINPVRATSE